MMPNMECGTHEVSCKHNIKQEEWWTKKWKFQCGLGAQTVKKPKWTVKILQTHFLLQLQLRVFGLHLCTSRDWNPYLQNSSFSIRLDKECSKCQVLPQILNWIDLNDFIVALLLLTYWKLSLCSCLKSFSVSDGVSSRIASFIYPWTGNTFFVSAEEKQHDPVIFRCGDGVFRLLVLYHT